MNQANLARLLSPRSMAVVGASENLGMSNNAVLPMLEAGLDVQLINPNRETVYGQRTRPSLSALDGPVDAVLALVSAPRSADVVAEAAALGCGGVVVAAGGFRELGPEGAALEEKLVAAAGDRLAIIGPNCSGFMNVPRRVNLFTGGRIALRSGGLAVISQSGFLLRSTLAAGQQRQLGFGICVSSGNESVCSMADYLDLLADDPDTSVVCLVIEKVREPEAFLAALARLREADKAVVALKLGRTSRSCDIMRSHTGAIADEAWVYDVVLRSAGVVTATDIDDLVDRSQLLAQLPHHKWRPVNGVAVMASSGGVAGVAADAAVEEHVELPALEDLQPWVSQRIPGDGSVNPLDLTGFVMRDQALLQEMFSGYAAAAGVDALVLCWWAGEGDETWSRTLLEPYAQVAATAGVPLVVTPVETSAVGAWTGALRDQGVVFCRGLRSTYRALRALDQVATAPPPRRLRRAAPNPTRPPALLDSPAGPMVPFAETMALLAGCGLPVAPYVVVHGDETEPNLDGFGARLVVKLADVPHRTELGAVRVGVPRDEVPGALAELRKVAAVHGVPSAVAVQAMVVGHGEAFIGLQGRSDLGPVVLFGRGGVLLEMAPQVGGRLMPLEAGHATELVEEVAGAGAFAGLRGQAPWATGPLSEALDAVGVLWQRCGSWLDSADLNPLIVTAGGVVVVDALLLAAAR